MRRARGVALLLLLASAVAAASVKHVNSTTAAYSEDETDEEGYRYGGKFVPNFSSQPYKAKFVQYPYATCQAPYDTFSFVTKIRVCRDTDGFITGLKYWSEHPTRHHDPTTLCDVVGHEGATDCETLKLYTEDWKWRKYRTVTNIRTSKVKDGRDRWRVVYLAFSYSDGTGVEFGSYPQQHGAKHEQWFMKPEPGKICGMNGIFSTAAICDAKSGYLQWVKPCGKCIPKPHNYKCDADYCTKAIKHKYKGGYKGDFEKDDLYQDIYELERKKLEIEHQIKRAKKGHGDYTPPTVEQPKYEQQPQYGQQERPEYDQYQTENGQYDHEQYGEGSDEAYQQGQRPLPLQQQVPVMQQPQPQAPSKHEKREQEKQERKEKKQEKLQQLQQQQQVLQQQQQQQQQQTKEKQGGLKLWPFPKLG